jgi:hypothetical protein
MPAQLLKLTFLPLSLPLLAHPLTHSLAHLHCFPPPPCCFAERCISCSRLLVAKGQHQAAFEAATAAATLLSFLRFGTAAVAETFCAAWVKLRLILNTTASSPATDITSEGALCLWEACARAAFFATPWFGYRFQAAVEAHIAAGWGTAEVRG